MKINCRESGVTCDIDQFYIIRTINVIGGYGCNLAEIYNLRCLVNLSAEFMIIDSRIKFLQNLKNFDNAATLYDKKNVVVGNLAVLETLISMNISFGYGYFSQYPIKYAHHMRESVLFRGYYIYSYNNH